MHTPNIINESRGVQHKLSAALMLCIAMSVAAFTLAEQEPAVGLLVAIFAFAGWFFNERPVALGRNIDTTGTTGITATDNITSGPLPTAMPRWLSTSLLVLATVLAGLRGYVEREAVSAFMWLLASVLLLKLWERRDLRDYGQMLTVCVFITVGATLGSTSVLLGVILLVQLPVLISAVMWYQLRAAQVRGGGLTFASVQHNSENITISKESVAGPLRALKRNLWKMKLVTLIGGGATAVGAFLIVPRGIGWQQLGEFGQPQGRTTGFTDVVDLDQSGLISESFQPVLTVQLRDGRGRIPANPPITLYLRGVALDQYSGREWRAGQSLTGPDSTEDEGGGRASQIDRSLTRRSTPGVPEVEITPTAARRASPEPSSILTQKITLRQQSRGDAPVFSVWRPRRVYLPSGGDINVDTVTLSMSRRSEVGQVEYTVTSWESKLSDTPRSMVREDGTFSAVPINVRQTAPWNRWRRGQVTFPSQRVLEAAQTVLLEAGIEADPAKRPPEADLEAATALSSYIQRACTYTLDIPAVPLKDDPIEFFLFASRRGHCELFASALTALCRSVGIDARLVAGYAASEYDPATGTYVVRQSDAHAWCEVNTAPGQWTTLDGVPSASAAALRAASVSWYTPMERFLADVRDSWNNSVIMFDSGAQQRILGGTDPERPWYFSYARRLNTAINDWQRAAPDPTTRSTSNLGTWILWGVSITLATVTVGAVWIAYRLRLSRARAQLPGWGARSPGALRLIADLDAYFTRIGKPRAPHTPLRTHALHASLPAQQGTVLRSVDAIYNISFAARAEETAIDWSLLRREIRAMR
jgi:hypothetical protein